MQTVLRVFDVFISEGSTVLYRVALAILRVASVSLMACNSRVQFANTLQVYVSLAMPLLPSPQQICIQYQDADHLLRTAFRITRYVPCKVAILGMTLNRLSRKEMASHDVLNTPMLKTVREPVYKPFYRPKIDVDSAIIEELHVPSFLRNNSN